MLFLAKLYQLCQRRSTRETVPPETPIATTINPNLHNLAPPIVAPHKIEVTDVQESFIRTKIKTIAEGLAPRVKFHSNVIQSKFR